MTAHSPVGLHPEEFGVVATTYPNGSFANNDLLFEDATKIDHEQFSFGLRKSLYNYMHGICFDEPLQNWFDFKIPRTRISPDYIQQALQVATDFKMKPQAKLIWLGTQPQIKITTKSKKGQTWEIAELLFHNRFDQLVLTFEKEQGLWLAEQLENLKPSAEVPWTLQKLQNSFEEKLDHFELFWFSKPMQTLRTKGLLAV
jgi:hypothetical protein